MSDDAKPGMFKRGWEKTKGAARSAGAHIGRNKKKYIAGAAVGTTTAGVAGYYALRKRRRAREEQM
jgi:hypothetical protein